MRRTLYAQREGDFGPTAAARQSARRGPAGPGRRSASPSSGAPRFGQESVHQNPTGPASGLDGGPPRTPLPGADQCPGDPRAGGRARGWDHADHAPGSATRLSRDHVTAREGGCGQDDAPTPAPGHAEAGSSVATTPTAGATNTGDDGENLTRTFLLGEEEDISTWA